MKNYYYKISLPFGTSPKNWICGTPKRIFGKTIFVVWKIARKNYPWSK